MEINWQQLHLVKLFLPTAFLTTKKEALKPLIYKLFSRESDSGIINVCKLVTKTIQPLSHHAH